jgi:hypothetical protein
VARVTSSLATESGLILQKKLNAISISMMRECKHFFVFISATLSSTSCDMLPHSHSTGRGGAANLTSAAGPAVEHHPHEHGEYLSAGRGGAGNIVKDRSVSRDPEQRSKSKEGHGITGFLKKVGHHKDESSA